MVPLRPRDGASSVGRTLRVYHGSVPAPLDATGALGGAGGVAVRGLKGEGRKFEVMELGTIMNNNVSTFRKSLLIFSPTGVVPTTHVETRNKKDTDEPYPPITVTVYRFTVVSSLGYFWGSSQVRLERLLKKFQRNKSKVSRNVTTLIWNFLSSLIVQPFKIVGSEEYKTD